MNSISDGVLYVQFLANFGTQVGGGTPHLRFYDDSGYLGAIGAFNGDQWEYYHNETNSYASSGITKSSLRFIIIRFDYDNKTIKYWVDPDLSVFDYSNPTNPTSDLNNVTPPSFNRIELYFRYNGTPGIDEIHSFYNTRTEFSSDEVYENITIGTGETLTLQSNGSLNVTGTLTNNGSIVMNSRF